jgi:hypothetical protein
MVERGDQQEVTTEDETRARLLEAAGIRIWHGLCLHGDQASFSVPMVCQALRFRS